MKKRLLPITILASLGVAALAGCGGGSGGGGGGGSTVDVTGVTLNKTSLELYPEGSEKLVATVAPADATDKSVTWKSGDTRICTVDAEGLVTAVAVGTAKVTVTTVDGGYKAECNVTVKLNMNSISISNKAEFADGMEAGANKAVSVTGDPTINATDLANKGLLTITSSNTAVATTNKLMVYAVAAGTTTITASLFGKTDSFELTVVGKQTNKDKFGTDHEGDAADPFTNEDALKAAKWLKANGGYGTEKYYIKGEVDYFYHNPGERTDKYVSYFLKPATAGGEQFEVYKTLKSDGSALKDSDIWAGGIATAFGAFADYNGQIETSAATFVSCEGTAPAPRAAVAKTFAEALALGKGLRDGESTYDMPQFEAYVTDKSESDFFLTATKAEAISDKKASTIQLYNVPEALAATLLKNAKVKVTNSLKNYHGQVENLFAVTADNVSVLEAGEPWVEPEPEKITVTQALEKINAIDISGVTADKTTLYVTDQAGAELKFEVSGVIVKVGTWNSSYGNGDAYMQDEAGYDADKALQLFRINDKEVFDKLVADETKVSVVCKLAAYVRVSEGVPSIGARETNANPVVTISGDVPPQPEPEKITVAQALEKINALDYSGVTKNNTNLYVKDASGKDLEFEVSGIITKVGSWSSQYGNGDAYMQDEAGYDASKALQLFRINDKAVFDKLVADETEVSVVCKLVLFVKLDSESKPYVAGRETNANPVVTISGEGGGGEDVDAVQLVPGTNGSAYKVKAGDTTYEGVKVGTGSKVGDMTIKVPATATKVTLHAAAWNGKAAVLTVTAENATVDKASLTLVSDSGIAGTANPFVLAADESTYVCVLNLSNVTGAVSIKLATTDTANGRFVVWNVVAE